MDNIPSLKSILNYVIHNTNDKIKSINLELIYRKSTKITKKNKMEFEIPTRTTTRHLTHPHALPHATLLYGIQPEYQVVSTGWVDSFDWV